MSYSFVFQLPCVGRLLRLQTFLMNRSDLVISSPKPNVCPIKKLAFLRCYPTFVSLSR